MNINFEAKLIRHGIFPIGGGIVDFELHRSFMAEVGKKALIKSINILQRGDLKKINLNVVYNKSIANSINLSDYLKAVAKEIKKILLSNKQINFPSQGPDKLSQEIENLQIETELNEIYGNNKCFTYFTYANFYYENTIITCESLFSEKKPPTLDKQGQLKKEFFSDVEKVLANKKMCFDEYTVDHLIIFMALASGDSAISVGEISLHTLTAIEIIKKFIPLIKVDIERLEENNENNLISNIIRVEGTGI